MEILEIISDNGKTLKVKTMSETKKGHKQQDVFNLRKTTNLKKIILLVDEYQDYLKMSLF